MCSAHISEANFGTNLWKNVRNVSEFALQQGERWSVGVTAMQRSAHSLPCNLFDIVPAHAASHDLQDRQDLQLHGNGGTPCYIVLGLREPCSPAPQTSATARGSAA